MDQLYIYHRERYREISEKKIRKFIFLDFQLYIYIRPRKINNLKRRKKDTHTQTYVYKNRTRKENGGRYARNTRIFSNIPLFNGGSVNLKRQEEGALWCQRGR